MPELNTIQETLPLLETYVTISPEDVLGKPYSFQLTWRKMGDGGDATFRNYFVAADDSRSFIVWLSAIRAAKSRALQLDSLEAVQV